MPFDLLLTSPSPVELELAFERACPFGVPEFLDREHWQSLLDDFADTDEGRRQFESATGSQAERYVSVAWWCDHRGVKHVRLSGGDTGRPGWHPHHSRLDEDLRPPLWHAFKDRVFGVTRPGEATRWLASCACGETGEPLALAWMGERCGPCHDRREEGLPLEEAPVTIRAAEAVVFGIAFDPAGQRLAVSSAGRCVRIHDLSGGEPCTAFDEGSDDCIGDEEELRPLVFSPDGRYLAVADPESWVVCVWDLLGEKDLAVFELPYDDDARRVCALDFSPDQRQLVTRSETGALGIFSFSTTGARRRDPAGVYDSFAFSPDGDTLALAQPDGRVIFFGCRTSTQHDSILVHLRRNDESIHLVRYSPDGRRLVFLTGVRHPAFREVPNQLFEWDLDQRRETKRTDLPVFIRVADLSPDGRFLAFVVQDEQHAPGEVLFFDLAAWRSAGRLAWDPDSFLTDLSFSPDGETLATASNNGIVKLWPWRLLLGV